MDGPERCFVLTPLDHGEALTLQEAGDRAKKSPGTIRNWCESEGLGRRIGGKWYVSKVALEMYLNGGVKLVRRQPAFRLAAGFADLGFLAAFVGFSAGVR